MKMMITGHRPQRLRGQEEEVRLWISKKITDLKPDVCISGMAEGADLIFAKEAIKHNIPLDCYYPFRKDKFDSTHVSINAGSRNLKFISEKWSKQCYVIRDRAMVDDSDIVLVVWDGIAAGGTYFTMEYAKKKGKQVIVYMVDKNEK